MKLPNFIFLIFLATSCTQNPAAVKESVTSAIPADEHSFSNPSRAIVRHLDLDIKVDFDSKTITGEAGWIIDNVSEGNEIIFDESGLTISKVTLDDEEKEAVFYSGEEVKFHGRALHVGIKRDTKRITIYYSTAKDAVGLQWLTPGQTEDKKYPFMFTQGESVWTRTWIPCQDSPGIRYTYNATVAVPPDLIPLMSAANPVQKNDSGIYHFEQKNPIPSYLMALAAGDLRFKSIDFRTGVYAEPSMIDKAAWEFADLGVMVDAGEKLFGTYRWGRFDVLVLPPSFPYGGMENPCLTFLMPGVIAGDRSLVTLLAHELAHSWSGNLVTNATWDDIWLNEGLATYVEHRIDEEIYGRDEAEMLDVLSRDLMTTCVQELGDTSRDTHLKLNLSGRNADDWFTDIPYEKGYAFFQTMDCTVSRARFDLYLKNYFNTYAFQSLTTTQFLADLNKNLLNFDTALENKLRIKEWVYGPGIPGNITPVYSAVFQRIDSIIADWRITGITKGLSEKVKSTNQRIYFIEHLPDNITVKELTDLDKEFSFTIHGNFEVKVRWYRVAIVHQYRSIYSSVEDFMLSTSRIPSLLKLYKVMIATPEGRVWAEQIFRKARPVYHPETVQFIEQLFNSTQNNKK